MSATEVLDRNLLERVRQMQPSEFEAFVEQAMALRVGRTATTLSPAETALVQRINRGLSIDMRKRYSALAKRRNRNLLTSEEHQELLELTQQAENQDVDRTAALIELAKLRQVPLRMLMKQMGIQAQPIPV